MLEIFVPFSGFYESFWDSCIDDAVSRAVENYVEEHPGVDIKQVRGHQYFNTNFADVRQRVARAYVVALENYLWHEVDTAVILTFKELISPREYNFKTDRILCEISEHHATRLFAFGNSERLQYYAAQKMTTRSGFISFYNPDMCTWGALERWDVNQLSILLDAAVDIDENHGTFYDHMLDYMYEEIQNAVDDNIDWPAIEGLLAEGAVS